MEYSKKKCPRSIWCDEEEWLWLKERLKEYRESRKEEILEKILKERLREARARVLLRECNVRQ